MVDQCQKPKKNDITPWGGIWSWKEVIDGVFWVSTPIHGGMVIDLAVAETALSTQARSIGSLCGPWICFEEDCAVSIPLFEHPEWGNQQSSRLTSADMIRAYFPHYFSPSLCK